MLDEPNANLDELGDAALIRPSAARTSARRSRRALRQHALVEVHEPRRALGGVRVVDTVHVLCFIFFVGFILVHPYLASLGHTPTAHFKAMITGWEEVE